METLSYCQLMERCITLEAEVAQLRGRDINIGSKNALDNIVKFIKSDRNPTLKDYIKSSEKLFEDGHYGVATHVIAYVREIGESLEELRQTTDEVNN